MTMTMQRISLLTVGLLLAATFSFVNADTSDDLVEQGNKLWYENQLEAAEKSFQQAIEQAPESGAAYERLANLYLASNRISESIPFFKHAIIMDPENAKLFAGLSLAYLHQQEYSKADAMANQAHALAPDLKHVDKLVEYIALKKKVMAQAELASVADRQPATAGTQNGLLLDKAEISATPHSTKMYRAQ